MKKEDLMKKKYPLLVLNHYECGHISSVGTVKSIKVDLLTWTTAICCDECLEKGKISRRAKRTYRCEFCGGIFDLAGTGYARQQCETCQQEWNRQAYWRKKHNRTGERKISRKNLGGTAAGNRERGIVDVPPRKDDCFKYEDCLFNGKLNEDYTACLTCDEYIPVHLSAVDFIVARETFQRVKIGA